MITQLKFNLDGDGETVVKFSSEALLTVGDNEHYNAWARNSYVARVEFPDGYVVLQALPRGAARMTAYHYSDRVLAFAKKAREDGANSVVWDE